MRRAVGSLLAAAWTLWAPGAEAAGVVSIPPAAAGQGSASLGAQAEVALPVPYVIADQGACTYAPENTLVIGCGDTPSAAVRRS